MYENAKTTLICPVCGNLAELFCHTHYVCNRCSWDSLNNTLDIASSEQASAVLSNFFPHNFMFYTSLVPKSTDEILCLSMESFLQSLAVKDPKLQKYICGHYSGSFAKKLKSCLRDWRKDGIVFWQGLAIQRDSELYDKLITNAYDCLFEGNDVFRELILPKFKGIHLIYSIGKDSKSETLLTEAEFRYQLNRLIQRLDYIEET